jgi:hypothetical protein
MRCSSTLAFILFSACGDSGSGPNDGGRADAGADSALPMDDGGARPDRASPPDGGDASDADLDAEIDDGGPPDGGAPDSGSDAGTDGGASCVARHLGSVLGTRVATGSSVGETDDFESTCTSGVPDVEFGWRAPHDGTFFFDTAGTDYSAVLTILPGDCAGPEIACDAYGGFGLASIVALTLTAGTEIVIVIEDASGDPIDYVLNIADDASFCDMPACEETGAECSNSIDDDGDGESDCNDVDCLRDGTCTETGAECGDSLDNDGDGRIDCRDFECDAWDACSEVGDECAGGLDDDGDAAIDCGDFDCRGDTRSLACLEEGAECSDGLDNDMDRAVDCADAGCLTFEPCDTCADVDLMMRMGAAVAMGNNTTAVHRRWTCGRDGFPGYAGREVTFSFTPPMTGEYLITTVGSDYDTVLSVLDGDCNGGEIACHDDVNWPADDTARLRIPLVAGHAVVIVLDGAETADVGNYVLNISVTAEAYRAPSASGELVITEIMSNPSGPSETGREWIKVENLTADTLDLGGCVLRGGAPGAMATIPAGTLVRQNQRAVFGGTAAGFTPNATFAFALDNDRDSIRLECGTPPVRIDEVAWDVALGSPVGDAFDGLSQTLDNSFATATLNDEPTYWCSPSVPYSSYNHRDMGYPFRENGYCFR